ncbi:MAG: toprim domain-containing protein [Candidatus Zixiibacteriota bacterium]
MTRTDIESYISGKGLRVWSKKYDEIRVDCPFCDPPDAKGHLYISVDGLFMCHRCSASGNFYQFQERLGDRPSSKYQPQWSNTINRILEDATRFYSDQLTTEIRHYLNNRLISDDAIGKCRLGYAGGSGLKNHLADKCHTTQQMNNAGLIRDDGSEYFRRNIVIPYMSHGKITLLRGRTNPFSDSKKAYFPLPNTEVQLYNRDVLCRDHDAIIITEGEFDCIVLSQHGYAAVGVPGANIFSEDWSPMFDRVGNIYCCFDGDEKGRQGAMRVAHILGPMTLIVEMPEGQDVTDFFVSGKNAIEFQALLDRAKNLLDIEIDSVAALPENLRLSKLSDIIPMLTGLPPIESRHYRSVLSNKLGVGMKVIDAGLIQHRKALEKAAAQTEPDKKEVFTDDEKARAQKLLEDPRLLERLLDDLEAIGCIGEDDNKLIVCLTLVSRVLDEPISLIVKGESSGRKSHIVEKVAQFFPREEILDFTTISPKALFHRQEPLSHKALIVYERPGGEDADYSIRSLQSEKKLKISITVKNPATGDFEAHDKEIPGPVAYIETTTQTHIHLENETRCFEIFIDESEEQTKRIHRSQREAYSGHTGHELPDLRVWHAAQTLLMPKPVFIPYIDHIRFPTKPLRVRRDFPRFLSLIAVSAILHQYQRKKQTIDGLEYVVADLADYGVAYTLADSILRQTVKSLTPKAEELIRFIATYVEDDPAALYTLAEIAGTIGWKKETVKKHHKNCVSEGLVECVEGRQGVAHKFSFVRLPAENSGLLISPEELKRLITESQMNPVRPGQKGTVRVNPINDSSLTSPETPDQPEAGGRNENA